MALEPFVVEFRRKVRDLLRREASLPVYGYLPDDVAHLPVLVVGRPSIVESIMPAVMTMTLDVSLLGRRIADEDSQAELDALADQMFDVLGGTRSVKVEDIAVRCTGLLPATVFVAAQEMPAYLATVSIDVITC